MPTESARRSPPPSSRFSGPPLTSVDIAIPTLLGVGFFVGVLGGGFGAILCGLGWFADDEKSSRPLLYCIAAVVAGLVSFYAAVLYNKAALRKRWPAPPRVVLLRPFSAQEPLESEPLVHFVARHVDFGHVYTLCDKGINGETRLTGVVDAKGIRFVRELRVGSAEEVHPRVGGLLNPYERHSDWARKLRIFALWISHSCPDDWGTIVTKLLNHADILVVDLTGLLVLDLEEIQRRVNQDKSLLASVDADAARREATERIFARGDIPTEKRAGMHEELAMIYAHGLSQRTIFISQDVPLAGSIKTYVNSVLTDLGEPVGDRFFTYNDFGRLTPFTGGFSPERFQRMLELLASGRFKTKGEVLVHLGMRQTDEPAELDRWKSVLAAVESSPAEKPTPAAVGLA